MYSCSPTLSQISLKNSFGKVIFQILAKIEMTRNKNLLTVAAILKRYNIFKFFCRIVYFYSPYIYGANSSSLQNSGGKVVFLRLGPWNPPPPLGTKGSKSTLVT